MTKVSYINETFVLIVVVIICITAMTIVTLYMFRGTQNNDDRKESSGTGYYCPQCGSQLVVGKYEPRVKFGKAQTFYALICTECGYISPVGTHIRKEAESEYAAYIQGRTDFEYITDHNTTIQIQKFGLEEQMVNIQSITDATDSAKEKVRKSRVGKDLANKIQQHRTSKRAKKKFKELRNSSYSVTVTSSSNADRMKSERSGTK